MDVENLIGDAFHFFKTGTFDSSRKLRVRFTNQPAIDDGGLTRQFFNKLFLKLSDPKDNDRLFGYTMMPRMVNLQPSTMKRQIQGKK